ncbi:hypothetical protein OIE63_23730 [Streptomyces sp. NBC_01795]|uniref:hypothetical protein n=2 Tax=unclassified Streptomyces TaxID=2593676 RepID=UPI002DD7A2A7|nr:MULTISPECIES: hypothetical protein [unclassified Streptomyces]WSA94250.1 hypothetical protein OIE63_23730 [Streptomyces sp. NBC_01795]WSS13129.1 hypothetical protein OG533_15390 [Streptomyces sp. NBC_01186]
MGQSPADLCRQDMGTIETAVTNIRTAVQKVTELMGSDTWAGPTADSWAEDFNGRMSSLNYLFDSYPAEEQQLIAKAGELEPK